jgi:tetratricopeptide (TPR) repeat protein
VLVRKLMNHNEVGEAKIWLSRLQESIKSNQKEAKSVTLGASLLTDIMRRFPPLADEITADNLEVLGSSLRKSDDKAGQLALASFLGASHRVDEAVDLCEPLLKDLRPQTVVAVAVTAVAGSQATPKQFERVEALVKAANKQAPGLAEWDMQLAILKERQAQYMESEALYRSVLKREPDNPFAMNNLAFLIGLRSKSAEANELIQFAVTKLGPVAEILDTRAAILHAQGKLAAAEKDILAALNEGKTPYRLFHLAEIQLSSGQTKEAAKSIKAAVDLGLRVEMLHPLETGSYQTLLKLR